MFHRNQAAAERESAPKSNSKFYLFDVATVAVRRVRSLLHLAHVGNVVSFTIISYDIFANNEFFFPAELFSWLNLKPIILGKFQYFVEMESFYLWFMAPGSKYLYSMMVCDTVNVWALWKVWLVPKRWQSSNYCPFLNNISSKTLLSEKKIV